MNFVVVSIAFEVTDGLLPVGSKDIFVLPSETLMDLGDDQGQQE